MTTVNDQPRVLTLRTQGSDVSQVQGRLLDAGANIATQELAAALFGLSTRKAVLEIQQKLQLPVTGTVDETTADALQHRESTGPRCYRVLGTVRHPNGQPARKLTVRAFDRDLRQEQALGRLVAKRLDHGLLDISYDVIRQAYNDGRHALAYEVIE